MNKKTVKRKKEVVNRFPPGWNEERVLDVIAHYDHQSEDEAVAEAEAALERLEKREKRCHPNSKSSGVGSKGSASP